LLALASGAWNSAAEVASEALYARADGADGKRGPFSARDCHSRNAPVRKRKQAATPAKKRRMKSPFGKEIRHRDIVQTGAYSVNYARGSRPLKRCRSIAAARPGVPSGSSGSPRRQSRIASAASADSG